MFVPWRRSFVKSSIPSAMSAAAILLGVLGTGCESTPIRAFRGARHYAAGTEALKQNDDRLAISELEEAAVLVPHASEIQNHLGIAYWSDGRPQMAQLAFERAIELDCDNDIARVNLERLMRSDDLLEELDVDVIAELKVKETKGVDENDE